MSLISPATSVVAADLPPRWVRVRWVARALLGLVVTAWSLLLIAWLTLHWGILPHIQQWREPIEQRASKALGVPVRIGQIDVRSRGWVPSFELREVVLLDPDQRPALRLPRISASVSPRSLLALAPRFEQLLIDGAELEVRRDVGGHIYVGGLNVSASHLDQDDASSAAADWFFAQGEFVIRGGALRWVDQQRAAAPLALADVQLVVRNGLRSHEIRIDATPPPEWGDRFTLTGRFTQPLLARNGDWRRWSGSGYVDLPRADLHELRQHVDMPFELNEGAGALRGWFDIKNGEPIAATVDLALRSVTLRLAAGVDPLKVEEVQGRVLAQRSAEGAILAVQRVTFLTGDNIRWPQGDMKLTWKQREGQPPSGGEFSAQRLDIGVMAEIASRVPMGDAMRKLLVELAPKGIVTDLSARWDGPIDAPSKYRAKGTLTGLSLASHAAGEAGGVGRPGLRNAAIKLDASEQGGEAQLSIAGGAIDLPGVFDESMVPFDQLNANLQWKIEPSKVAGQPPAITLQVKSAQFSNPDAKGELIASWSTGPGTGAARGGRLPGRLDLDGKLTQGHAARTYRYLPIGIPRETRDYLEHALQAGNIVGASYRVKGDLWDFPFFRAKSAKDGEFRIDAKVEDARFAFVPHMTASAPAAAAPAASASAAAPVWPALTAVATQVVLERGTLNLLNGRAQAGNLELRNIQGAIRSLESDAQLGIDGTIRGPANDMLRVVNTSPIGGWIGKALDTTTASGNAELKLGLNIPLMRVDATTVKGSVALAGNDVRVTADGPMLTGAKGRVDFSNKGFAIVAASAKVYGGELQFDGGPQPDGSLRFSGRGTVSAEGLRRANELGTATKLASALTGQTSYAASLAFVRGQAEMSLTSNLVGLAVNLPAPLTKTAEASLPLRLQTSLDPPVANQPPRDTLRLDLGNIVQAVYQREHAADETRVLRGGIGVLEAAPTPATGVAANLNLKSLNIDEWDALLDKHLGPGARETGTSAGYTPNAISLRVQELAMGPRHLTNVSAGLSQEPGGPWRANIDSDQLNGYVEYRPPQRRAGAAAAGGRVYARLSRASLPKSDVAQVETLLDQQPSAMPALDVVIDDFELRGKHLGRVEVEALNRASPQGRDWQLTRFALTTPEATLTASGNWSAAGPLPPRGTPVTRRSVMDFKLALSDSGAFLDRLGTTKAIKGGKGQLSGQIAWVGSPFALDYPSLSGQINVAIEAGQFLKADPGAARLLGVLSLQSLPRRLSLDFRDVFQEGFAFDDVTGDVAIAQGVAKTNNLRMRGVQAAVLMEGSADIARETQDLRVVVVPEINAGTAALAYAVINPAIGLGAFLAQAILKKPLSAASTREFHVSGPWADPKVERVERAAAIADPASSTSRRE